MRTLLTTLPGEETYFHVRQFTDAMYSLRLGVENPAHAEVFSCIIEEEKPIASTGLFLASAHPILFFERFFDKDILCEIDSTCKRNAFAEIGALAVDTMNVDKKQVQLLAATTILCAGLKAYNEGIQYIVFVGDKLLSRFSKMFGIEFHNLGAAIPKNIDADFQEKLDRYLKAGRATYVAETKSIPDAFMHFTESILPTLGVSASHTLLNLKKAS